MPVMNKNRHEMRKMLYAAKLLLDSYHRNVHSRSIGLYDSPVFAIFMSAALQPRTRRRVLLSALRPIGILNVKTYVPLKVISACQLLPYLLGVFVKMKEL